MAILHAQRDHMCPVQLKKKNQTFRQMFIFHRQTKNNNAFKYPVLTFSDGTSIYWKSSLYAPVVQVPLWHPKDSYILSSQGDYQYLNMIPTMRDYKYDLDNQ